jgi:hypothetical protein
MSRDIIIIDIILRDGARPAGITTMKSTAATQGEAHGANTGP